MPNDESRLVPTPDEFGEQLAALKELESIDNRMRRTTSGAIERFFLGVRRANLARQIDAWTRRFAHDLDDVEGHALEV